MDKLTLTDIWQDPKSLAKDFEQVMSPNKRKPIPDQTIDYTRLKVGQKVALEKTTRKC